MKSARSLIAALATGLVFSSVLLLYPVVSVAQVVNGSFEAAGQPSLQGWRLTCVGLSDEDAPAGGGTWSLKLSPGNVQDCFPGVASQTIPSVQNGEVWRLTAWARQSVVSPSSVSIYWQVVTSEGGITRLAADATNAHSWTRLSVVDTLYLAPGDSAIIVLDAGGTSGPAISGEGANFDLVSVERVGEGTFVPTGEQQPPEPGRLDLSQNYPNPFEGETTIPFHLDRPGYARLDVYDVLGRRVETLHAGYLPPGAYRTVWHAAGLPRGTYFGRLRAGRDVRVLEMTLSR